MQVRLLHVPASDPGPSPPPAPSHRATHPLWVSAGPSSLARHAILHGMHGVLDQDANIAASASTARAAGTTSAATAVNREGARLEEYGGAGPQRQPASGERSTRSTRNVPAARFDELLFESAPQQAIGIMLKSRVGDLMSAVKEMCGQAELKGKWVDDVDREREDFQQWYRVNYERQDGVFDRPQTFQAGGPQHQDRRASPVRAARELLFERLCVPCPACDRD